MNQDHTEYLRLINEHFEQLETQMSESRPERSSSNPRLDEHLRVCDDCWAAHKLRLRVYGVRRAAALQGIDLDRAIAEALIADSEGTVSEAGWLEVLANRIVAARTPLFESAEDALCRLRDGLVSIPPLGGDLMPVGVRSATGMPPEAERDEGAHDNMGLRHRGQVRIEPLAGGGWSPDVDLFADGKRLVLELKAATAPPALRAPHIAVCGADGVPLLLDEYDTPTPTEVAGVFRMVVFSLSPGQALINTVNESMSVTVWFGDEPIYFHAAGGSASDM